MPVSRSHNRFRNVTNVSYPSRMLEREDARRVGSEPTELTMLFYDGKTCCYFPHGAHNDTNPGDTSPEDGDDGHSVAEFELSVYPLVWGPDPNELQPSTSTPIFTGARGRTPGAVVKLKDIDTIELEESIIVKLEEPDARLYTFSVSRSRSSSPVLASYFSALQPDPTTGLLPPGWIMCRWDMCREIVPEASLKHHVLYSRAHASGVELATYCLWDHCGHDRGGNIFTHVRKTHFGDHVCNCCRNRFDQERQLNTHLKKLCTKRCGHCRALFATREDARAHYETRVCVPVALQDASLAVASTSTGPGLFRCLWAGCNAEVVSDDASIKRHLRFTHKLPIKATPSKEECRWAGCTREVKRMRSHVFLQHVKK